MKIKATFFVLLALITFNTTAQYVTIPNTNFVSFLQSHFPTCMNGNLLDTTCIAVTTVDSLDISYLNIANLTGIEYFDSLKYLNCSNNFNNSINFPRTPSGLLYLNCSNSSGLQVLPSMPNGLRYLYCNYTGIDSLPVLPDSLQVLNCGGNSFTYLSNLPLNLKRLHCHSCDHLTSIAYLPPTLRFLNCNNDSLVDLPTLPSTLDTLWCDFNKLTNLPVLPDSMHVLTCESNKLTSLPNIPFNLRALVCGDNMITSLPSVPAGLLVLNCAHNSISILPELSPNLQMLICLGNQISCFPIFPNTLTHLYLMNNPFTCLPNYVNAMDSLTLTYPRCAVGDSITNPGNCIGVPGITGYIYSDSNLNCLKDNGDTNITNVKVKLYDNNSNLLAQTYSASNGIFDFIQGLGTYSVEVDTTNQPYTVPCSTGVDSLVTLSLTNSLETNVNFSLACKPGYDIGVQAINKSGWVFPGQQHKLKVLAGDISHWYNLNCADGISGQLQLSISGPVTYSGVTPNALTPAITGNTFTYQISDFGTINNSEAFGLLFTTDTTAQSGDSICINATVTSLGNDNNTSNNAYQFCYNVINSYDPNMKEVYPVNVLPGYQDWFTYTIHFQNTGSAPAFNIRLEDTLDNNLDLETFQVINYSHYNTVSLQNNALSFRFPNIMLPDSTTNSDGSKGFVQYRIKPKPNLPLGTQIQNTAFIYFDYNPAIVTNTTVNEFTQTSSIWETGMVLLNIYPNPGMGKYSIKLPETVKSSELSLDVYNVLGEIVGKANCLNAGRSDEKTILIDISQQPNGMYFVNGKINGRFFYQRIVKQ